MNEMFLNALKCVFGTSLGLSLKNTFFWKLKPVSSGGYALHMLVLQNKPLTKLSRSIESVEFLMGMHSQNVSVNAKRCIHNCSIFVMFQKCFAFFAIRKLYKNSTFCTL